MALSQTRRRRPSPGPLAQLARPWLPEPRGAAPGGQMLPWRLHNLLYAILLPVYVCELCCQWWGARRHAWGCRDGLVKGPAVVHMTTGAHKRRQYPTVCCNCLVGSAQEHSTRWVAGSALSIRDCWALHDALVRVPSSPQVTNCCRAWTTWLARRQMGPKPHCEWMRSAHQLSAVPACAACGPKGAQLACQILTELHSNIQHCKQSSWA